MARIRLATNGADRPLSSEELAAVAGLRLEELNQALDWYRRRVGQRLQEMVALAAVQRPRRSQKRGPAAPPTRCLASR